MATKAVSHLDFCSESRAQKLGTGEEIGVLPQEGS